jgi:putative hydrolase of the HAD superfamily
MASTPYDVLLFDLGGVIVELAGMPAFRAWLPQSMSDEEIWERWIRSPAVRSFESGNSSAEAFASGVIAEFGLAVEPHSFLAEFEQWARAPFPGALDLLDQLRGRFQLACFSNTNAMHWPRFLGEMGLGEAFHAHFASHELGVLKPDREAYELVVRALGCPAERVLFLDDVAINVEGARDAGLAAHRVQGPEGARTLLRSLSLL